jgi:hypothetical protein
MMNRTAAPDAILKLVHERSGGSRFTDINDVVSREELAAITDEYKVVAGFDRASLITKP